MVVVLLVVVVCVWCVCVCVCVCCGTLKKRGKKPVLGFKNTSVCTFKTSPCMPAPRAHVFQHVRVVPVHTGTFERTHGDVLTLLSKHGGEGVIVSAAYQNLPTYGYHVLQRFTEETFGSFLFSSVRIDCEQHVPDSLQTFAVPSKDQKTEREMRRQIIRKCNNCIYADLLFRERNKLCKIFL